MKTDDDKECGCSSEEIKPKRKRLLVKPQTLKAILSIGPVAAKILHLVIELVKLFKT